MNQSGNIKESATSFLLLASAGQVDEAYGAFVGEGFRHHNPYFPGDAGSLMAGMRENALKHPEKTLEIQRILQDGDLVAVHSRVRMHAAHSGVALVHIFRFEAGKIVELWDIGQVVPESSSNAYGMF